jgi:hypothetical protein
MKHKCVVALCLVFMFGCSSAGRMLFENRQNLSNLSPGMSKVEVHTVMGQQPVRNFNNPYRTAMYIGKDGKPVETFYYWTDGNQSNGIADNELTPVVFVDGKVIGWGREFWTEFVTKYELRTKTE